MVAGLTRIARDAGVRAAADAAVQVSARWLVKRADLGLETLNNRTDERFSAADQQQFQAVVDIDRLGRELEELRTSAAHVELANAERLAQISVHANALTQQFNAWVQAIPALQVDQQRLFDGLSRVGDSLRVIVRLADVELGHDPVGGSDIESLDDAPLVSVVVPVRNRADSIGSCVESILAQDYPHLELVVVDDDSTDDLVAALERFALDPRLQLLRLSRVGDATARNVGIDHSRGDIIVNIDSDNRMYSGYVARLAQAYARHPEAACAVAAMVWDDGGSYVHVRHDRFDWQKLMRREVSLDSNCFSYRRALRDELGDWDTSLVKHSDWELAVRYTRDHPPMSVPAIAALYDARMRSDRISLARASLPSFTRVSARYRPPAARKLKVLIHAYDYPQLSESYVETEIAWFRRQGVEVEVYSSTDPGAPGPATVPVHRGDPGDAVDACAPDLIHCHWLSQVPAAEAVARARDLPLTVRSHAFDTTDESLERCIAGGIASSLYLFPNLIDDRDTGSVTVLPVPACFDSERFYPRIERDRWLVLRTAACLPTKDIETFFHVAAASSRYRFVLALAHIAGHPELPAYFEGLNASLGRPVDVRWDVGNDDMTALTAQAGVYLHTFGFIQPFGMPVSIAESMACGAIPIVRDSAAGRAYAGHDALYYDDAGGALTSLDLLAGLSDGDFDARSVGCAEHAYSAYADEVVLPVILDDWMSLVGAPHPATAAAR